MNEKKRRLLNSLGISIWIEKSFSHPLKLEEDQPSLINKNSFLPNTAEIEKEKVHGKKIKLMILVENTFFSPKESKILSAMFESIGLSESNYYCFSLSLPDQKNQEKSVELNQTPCPFFYLNEEITKIQPQALCILGKKTAAAILENTAFPWEERRKQRHIYPYNEKNMPICMTYHPQDLLISPQYKRESYQDLRLLQKMLN